MASLVRLAYRCAFLLLLASLSLASQSKSSTHAEQIHSAPASLRTGPYYALVIGNNNYKSLPKLQTAINDANEIARLLRDRYGFQTKVLLDATRQEILDAIVQYRKDLSENSNLLIYYAGHGHHDRDTDESYWLPVDAQAASNANWISADDITRDIRALSAAHVLVISDSCYSGYLTREADAAINPSERSAYLEKMLKSKSRTLMSSGGDEPVVDGGAPGHSIFGATIIESLNRIDQNSFTASDLFYEYVRRAVAGRSQQLPQYSVIRNSGHADGDFVFARASIFADRTSSDVVTPSTPHEPNAAPVAQPTTLPTTPPKEVSRAYLGQLAQVGIWVSHTSVGTLTVTSGRLHFSPSDKPDSQLDVPGQCTCTTPLWSCR